jgi:hypothetical protein
MYQNGEKYTILPLDYQMAIKYTSLFPIQGPPKFSQVGIFGLKI